jgi:hypothetical protein
MLRWLPFGGVELPGYGLVVQGFGVVAMIYGLATAVRRARRPQLPVHAMIFLTGLFTTVLGTGLAKPTVWELYPSAAAIIIILLGLGTAVLSLIVGRRAQAPGPARYVDDGLWFERWLRAIRHRLQLRTAAWCQRLEAARRANRDRVSVANGWRKFLDSGEQRLQHWSLAITLFVLLVVIIGGLVI